MSAFFSGLLLLYILAIGYHYVSSSPIQKMTLKKGTNQEIYALIVMHGMRLTYKGFRKSLQVFFFILTVSLFLLWAYKTVELFLISREYEILVAPNVSNVNYISSKIQVFLSALGVKNAPSFMLKIIFVQFCIDVCFRTASICREQIDEEKVISNDYKLLFKEVSERADSLLLFLLESIDKKKLVKVSLVSGRFYIGMVGIKKLSRLDLAYISIIPFKSGYRREDQTLSFNGNFISLYEKNGILEWDEGEPQIKDDEKLEEFQYVLPIKDIQSLSYFDNDIHNHIIKTS
ncbi:hypothetical protein KRX19_05505 [Cardiobacteriaceae bacterium TAE3-ERU3]|nr:hypothetical protein [Cardiobacteriaceae bacterium TAE3-ERU3]